MSVEVIYQDQATVLRRGLDERGWLYVEQIYFPLPKYDNNVRHRISLSPSGKTAELFKRWDGWAVGEGGLTGSSLVRKRLSEAEGAEIKRRLLELKNTNDFGELWAALYWRG